MSVYNVIAVAMIGVCTGIFNGLLASAGYVAPYMDTAGNLVAVQSPLVQNVITFSFVGLETITGIVLIILLLFFNVEKNLNKKQKVMEQVVAKGAGGKVDYGNVQFKMLMYSASDNPMKSIPLFSPDSMPLPLAQFFVDAASGHLFKGLRHLLRKKK